MSERKDLRGLVHEAVDKGADSVEDIHKAIASLPLKILEDLGIMPKVAKEVEGVQERSIGAVYDLIRQINHQVEDLATEILSKSPRRRSR